MFKKNFFSFDDDSRQCWVCLASDDDDDDDEEDNDKKPDTEWIHPCRCNGSGKLNFLNFPKKLISNIKQPNGFTRIAFNNGSMKNKNIIHH